MDLVASQQRQASNPELYGSSRPLIRCVSSPSGSVPRISWVKRYAQVARLPMPKPQQLDTEYFNTVHRMRYENWR